MRPGFRRLPAVILLLMLIAACGGDSDNDVASGADSGDGEGTIFEGIGEAASSGSGLLQAGPVTATTNPGRGWVEVDGQRIDFEAAAMSLYECVITDQNLSVIYETTGAQLRLSGLVLPDGWNLNLTVFAPNIDHNVSLRSGAFGTDGDSVSYEGTVEPATGGAVDIRMAANCASA